MAFRFIHTADLHLDSPLRSLALRDPELAEMISDASRIVLRRIVDLCLSEQVDALLIAGDLYDGSQTSMKTARFLMSELARLGPAGIRTFIIRGNHDAESVITRELTPPEDVFIYAGRAKAVAITKGHQQIHIHGLSFTAPHAPESLLSKYKPPVADALNIGLMHTSLNGSPGHDLYAPCALADLQASGFDYWALGHIHKRAEYPGAAHVVMPGIPQGRDIGEAGAGSVTLVSCTENGLHVEERVVAEAAFMPVTVNVTGLEAWHDLRGAVANALDATRLSVPHLVARLTLRGHTPLAARLLRDRDLALEEAQQIARETGGTWVETLGLDLEAQAPDTGALGELGAIITGEIRDSAGYQAALEALRRDLEAALPPVAELRDGVAQIDAALVEGGIAEVLARLGGGRA
ncbi:MAG: DNA repair exonuclease [Rhodobacteraceae bacterium]|nr:MAG: DNA repair exonuclease [Paracoccaceae bacterium]